MVILDDRRLPMWVQDTTSRVSDITIMNEARAMRDETLARMVTAAWHGIANLAARLMHVGHGHARTN
jgi:hypothetical protein